MCMILKKNDSDRAAEWFLTPFHPLFIDMRQSVAQRIWGDLD